MGDKQVVCGVSGGVDSTVLAVLLHEAGVNMRAIFVDNGLLRKNEAEEVRANFARMNVESETVDASERFLAALDGESDPERSAASSEACSSTFSGMPWETRKCSPRAPCTRT